MDNNNPPNPNIHTIVKAQIVFLLSTLTEDNFDFNQNQIHTLAEQHGVGTYLHFIRRLIVHSQGRLAVNVTFDTSTALTFRLLVQETQRLARDPYLADRFRESVDKGEGDVFRNFDLGRFLERVGLRPLEQLILASSFVSSSAQLSRKELEGQAAAIIRDEFEDAAVSLCQPVSFEHGDLSPSQLAKLMENLLLGPLEDPVLDVAQRQALVVAAQAKFGPEVISPILQRIFPSISLPPGSTLVQTLLDLGPDITSDPDSVHALMSRFGITAESTPTAAQAMEIISSLSRAAVEGRTLCDVNALMTALTSFNVDLDWAGMIRSFDISDRCGVDTPTLKLLIAILLSCPVATNPHAVSGFWQEWSNPLYQLRLLDALLSLPADTFNFVSLPGRRIVTVDDVSGASPTIKSLAANVQGHTWNSLDLFEVLVRLADSDSQDIRTCVRDMLDKAVRISAELVHMGLLQVPQEPWNEIRLEYTQRLLAMFLGGHPNHQLVFMRIWQIKPSYLTNAFRDFYEENPLNITRILDVAQDLKVSSHPLTNRSLFQYEVQILDSLLEVRPFTFALDVASLASRREYLNLDKWLADNIATHGAEFLHAVITFLDLKTESEKATRVSDPAVDHRTMPLNPQTIAIFLRVLRNSSSIMNESDVDYCLEVRNACLQIHPRLMNLMPGHEAEPGFSVVSYTQEIEAEVDSIYKQMYDEQITIEDVISLLQKTKASSSTHDHEIFSCMLHFLFDEYKFFQSFYPARELVMTGYLFGSIIQHRLVEYIPLGIAIRYVLDALNCPPETNLFKFGIEALSRFESRLSEWQPLCQALLKIPHLHVTHPELVARIQRAVATGDQTTSATDLGLGGIPIVEAPPIFTAIHVDKLEGEIEKPPEEVSDKILFIINNLAPTNFDAKLSDMKEQFQDQHARWLANYLVDQRISTEPNNHDLYRRFLDALGRKTLNKFILHETIAKSHILLNSEKTMQSTTERAVLKNVAKWLGSITFARDRPVKHNNISFKDLLIEGYENGRSIVSIPFVCRTLDGCADSTVFQLPNPWLVAVLSLLSELYHFAELKLNLKFEIEMLCKVLNIDFENIEAATILRNRPPHQDTLAGLPTEYAAGDINALPLGGYEHSSQIHEETQALPLGPVSSSDMSRALGPHLDSILSSILLHVVINPQLGPLATNHNFKRAVHLAIERAVREIILPVVERSVTIAGISTRELVMKDFVTDPSEDKIRKAGHLMAQKLAGSLALVTCKEPLRSNLPAHIRHCLVEHGFSEQLFPEQVLLLLTQDNADIACQVIEKIAMDRAVVEIDEALGSAYEVRRAHAEHRLGQPFWDPAAPRPHFSQTLPEPLRIKNQGVQPHQAAVYEDFDTKRKVTSRPGSTLAFARDQAALYDATNGQEGVNGGYIGTQDAMERFSITCKELDAAVLQLPYQSLAQLPASHEIRLLIRQIIVLAVESADRRQTPLHMSQKIVQLMYKTTSQLGREIYVAILDQLCHAFEEVAKEAISWLIYSDDERKYDVAVTVTLLKSGLITLHQLDQQLAKFMFTHSRPSLLSFTANLIRECLTSDPPLAAREQFPFCLEVLSQLVSAGKANEDVHLLLSDLQGPRRSVQKPEPDVLRGKLFIWFQQWVHIFQRSSTPEKSFIPFITQLTKQGVLKVEDLSSLFFRVCAEASVEGYHKSIAAGNEENAFQSLDACSRLIVYIIKYHGDASGVNNDQAKVHYLTKILSIFVLVLASLHEEQGADFQQKPFFRFFSSLINDLHYMEANFGTAYFSLMIAISDTLSSLQPTIFPGFAFSWMCLISHRMFMPKLLLSEDREGWAAFYKLLLFLLRFLASFLKATDLKPASRDLYRGTLRILLVLLHDFPDFLSEYYFSLCDVVPPRCIQLRNIILSAYPLHTTLPDPHRTSTTNDPLFDVGTIPPILSDFSSILKPGDLRMYLDQYLLGRSNPSFPTTLKNRLLLTTPVEDGSETYNLSLVNALVMYIGVSSVAQAKARSGSSFFNQEDPGVVLLKFLAEDLDAEGQHHLLSAVVLHLRYPNAHTYWFCSLMLHLFAEIKTGRFQEIITRVLLERFIVHRPHPWGALFTFIELLRNPDYDFWSKDFVREVPEVTLLLESVARSIFQ